MKSKYTTLYIVRHGETEANVKDIVSGHSESDLTKKGKKQAQDLAGQFKDISFDAIFSSDLERAKQTAEIISLEKKLLVNTNKLLRERNFGRNEGKSRSDYREENKETFKKLENLAEKERWKFKIVEDAESDEEIMTRFIMILREIAVTYMGKKVLVVSHGGIMRTFLIHLGWAKYGELVSGSIKNTGYIQLESDGAEFIVKEVNGIEKISKEKVK